MVADEQVRYHIRIWTRDGHRRKLRIIMSGNGNDKESLTFNSEFYNGNPLEFTTSKPFLEKVRTGLLNLNNTAITYILKENMC